MNNKTIKIKRKIPKEEIAEKFTKNETPKSQNSQKVEPKKSFTEKDDSVFSVISEQNTIFITCQAGVESLVKNNNEKIGITTLDIQDRIFRGIATEEQIYKALIWNRFANRIYLEISTQKTTTFDELFEAIEKISWKNYIPRGIAIVTEATSIKSQLSHTPSIQSITKKAIVKNLTEGTGTHHLFENRQGKEAHIQVFIIKDMAHILLDITGEALHKRGWRTESGEAPIKETLAAAIIALSGWKFQHTLIDPFCGSGTIAIEAAMIARNIAPGLDRHFAIESFPFFQENILAKSKEEARQNIYPSGKYTIIGQDINAEVLEKAKRNARRAGVFDDIHFQQQNFFDAEIQDTCTIITNPPYGVRLENNSDEDFYKNLLTKLEQKNITGGFITSYENINTIINRKIWKDRKLYNGGLPARFYKKIS